MQTASVRARPSGSVLLPTPRLEQLPQVPSRPRHAAVEPRQHVADQRSADHPGSETPPAGQPDDVAATAHHGPHDAPGTDGRTSCSQRQTRSPNMCDAWGADSQVPRPLRPAVPVGCIANSPLAANRFPVVSLRGEWRPATGRACRRRPPAGGRRHGPVAFGDARYGSTRRPLRSDRMTPSQALLVTSSVVLFITCRLVRTFAPRRSPS